MLKEYISTTLLLSMLLLSACKPTQTRVDVAFLSAEVAADSLSSFGRFMQTRMTTADLQLQLHAPLSENLDSLYLARIPGHALPWNEALQKKAANTTNKALALLEAINAKRFLPSNIKLLLMDGGIYGPTVFFTFQDCIVIPVQQLEGDDDEELLATMLHEMAHLISRKNPQLSGAFYQSLGYERLPQHAQLPPSLQRTLLGNPDAQMFADKDGKIAQPWVIRLADQKQYLGLIHARTTAGLERQKSFMAALSFQLFPLTQASDSAWAVQENGLSPASADGFLKKIGGNSTYFIHPEELWADHVAHLALGQPAADWRGQQLLNELAAELNR